MKTIFIVILCVALTPVLLIGVFVAVNWAPERTVAELQGRLAPPPSVFVDVAGMKVHLRDEGPREDASPLVLLHGTGSSLHAWEGWARDLKAKRRIIRYDMAGFGLTGPSPDGIYSIDDDVRLVIAILDKLGVERSAATRSAAPLRGAPRWRTPHGWKSSSWSMRVVTRAIRNRFLSGFASPDCR
jgi:hypothetical protein